MARFAAFLSYATADRAVAAKIHDFLESEGLQCWMFEKDEQFGDEWPAANARALMDSDVLVVLLSKQASKSLYVAIEAKTSHSVLPVRLEEVEPGEALRTVRLYHWLDVWEKPWEEWNGKLLESVRRIQRRHRAAVWRRWLVAAIAVFLLAQAAACGLKKWIPYAPSGQWGLLLWAVGFGLLVGGVGGVRCIRKWRLRRAFLSS
jgi:hypothetical protein